jgi:hypothetical protein
MADNNLLIQGIDEAAFPESFSGSPVQNEPLEQQVAALINGGAMPVGDKLAKMSDAETIALTKIAANRLVNESFDGQKDFKLSTFLVETVATLIDAAAGAVLDRAVSIGFLRRTIEQSLGKWALKDNHTLEFATSTNTYGFGLSAGKYATAATSIFGGVEAGMYASGAYSHFMGYQTGKYASGTHGNGDGYQTCQFMTGNQGTGKGVFALRFCSGNNASGYGYNAGARISGDNNTSLGTNSWATTPDPAAILSFATAAINATTQVITVASTAVIGTIGKRYPMRFNLITGTAPTGLATNGDYSVLVLSATQLQLIDETISTAGAGTFTLTAFLGRDFVNTTCAGAGSVPTDSNEFVAGNPAVTRFTTTASKFKTGVLPWYINDAAADADTELRVGQWYRIGSTGRTAFQKIA